MPAQMQEETTQEERKTTPKGLWISLKKSYDRFLRIRGNPHEIALGFALGLFIGMTPYMGFHMAIAICIAALLKWNKIAAAIGVWISNPLTAPFLYSATFYVGSLFFSVTPAYFMPTELSLKMILEMLKHAPQIFWILTVGGAVLGLPLAVAGYYLALSTILKYREEIQRKLARDRKRKKLRKKPPRKKKEHRFPRSGDRRDD